MILKSSANDSVCMMREGGGERDGGRREREREREREEAGGKGGEKMNQLVKRR